MYKKKGFTLAEVLITLTIVGVISAITVPNLVGNASKKSQTALLRKTYVELTEAIDMEISQKDVKSVTTIFNSTDKLNEFLVNTFKVAKNCQQDSIGDTKCLPTAINYISGAGATNMSSYITEANASCIVNTAGVAICMSLFQPNATTLTDGFGEILIDTNSTKEPNIKGRDIFRLHYKYNGDIEDAGVAANCAAAGAPDGCFVTLQNDNWVMEY
jgi:prepilin-type N-terminal cleavage/methylation domain-containing protein